MKTELFGFYGPLLSEKQQAYLQAYLADDLGLSEIAENEEISRQAVSDQIKRALVSLDEFESKIHLRRDYLQRRKLEGSLLLKYDSNIVKKLIDLEEK
ncbi:YlxM family DNA-binding protein [Oenococcus alcoholitolerans]|uniref:Signal peptide protein n=1 Tax=Oenococcus alcoholitolerans TaxID=931074 RepID=A0ABR4XSA3_9LACO|nr:signal peptide protein [Oenococcus alcoholitolerans]